MDGLSPRTRRWALLLSAWTLVTWVTRVPLAWSDDALSTGGKVLATVPVLLFVALAGAAGAAVLGRRAGAGAVVGGLAAWSIAYWAVRIVLIATNGHEVGFVVVHAVLAVVAGALSALALRGLVADGALPRLRARGGAPAGS